MTELKITEEDAEKLNSKFTMIVTPIARHPTRQFTASMMETTQNLIKAGLKFHIKGMAGCSDLAYTRNHLASSFLESECTDMLWIDDDIGWASQDVLRLLLSDKDFIGGAYRKKLQSLDVNDPMAWCIKLHDDRETVTDVDGSYEVKGIGMGFVKITRKVFQTIVDANPNAKRGWESTESEPKNFYSFFHFDGFGNGEDYSFCNLWQEYGGKVWVDPVINLIHCGDYEFFGNVGEMVKSQEGKVVNVKSAA